MKLEECILEEKRDKLIKRINEMQKTLDRFNYKIEGYEKKLLV